MKKINWMIIPALIGAILLGWSTTMAQGTAMQDLTNKLTQIGNLPSGTTFQLNLTDSDLTAAAEEYLTANLSEVQTMLKQNLGVAVSVSEPLIRFTPGKITLSLKTGVGFIKTNANVTAAVSWNGSSLDVRTESIHLPVVKVDPATADNYLRGPLNNGIDWLKRDYDIQAVQINEGSVAITATKK